MRLAHTIKVSLGLLVAPINFTFPWFGPVALTQALRFHNPSTSINPTIPPLVFKILCNVHCDRLWCLTFRRRGWLTILVVRRAIAARGFRVDFGTGCHHGTQQSNFRFPRFQNIAAVEVSNRLLDYSRCRTNKQSAQRRINGIFQKRGCSSSRSYLGQSGADDLFGPNPKRRRDKMNSY